METVEEIIEEQKKKECKRKWKSLFLVVLTYLIPIINISIVCANYSNLKRSIIAICSVLSSTAAASACTIKAVNGDESNTYNIMQAFALVCSVVSFIACLIYEIGDKLYIHILEIVILTIIANIITVIMFLKANNELEKVVENSDKFLKKEVGEMVEKAKKVSKKTGTRMTIIPER